MLDFLDTMMSAGLGVMVLGSIFIGVLLVRRARGQIPTFDNPGWRLDATVCLVWGGMLLVQLSNILMHKESGTIYNVSTLGWWGTAGYIFILGVFAGRLLLRREMQLYKAKQDEQMRAAGA